MTFKTRRPGKFSTSAQQIELFEDRLLLAADFSAIFGDAFIGQGDNTVQVDLPSSATGELNAWVDLDGDGQFHSVQERVLSSVQLVQGANHFVFEIPFYATGGTADVRLTVSTPDADSHTLNTDLVLNAWQADVNLGTTQELNTFLGPSGIVAADFNNDGDIDVFAANITGSSAEYYDNLGNGTFSTTDINTPNLANTLNELEVADVNNDGLLDVVAGTSGSSDTVEVYIQQPVGVFSLVQRPSFDSAEFVEIADFNGDGFLDIITADEHVNILINNGDGTFAATSVDTTNRFPSGLAVGDVDGDGDIDAVATNSWEVVLYRNDGNGNFTTVDDYITSSEIMWQIHVLDLNQDGMTDIVGGRFILGNMYFFENTGAAYVERTMGVEGGRHGVEFGDVDGDGDIDILTANISDGTEIYENTGDHLTYNRTTIHDELSEFVQAGDFDGDGDLDFVYEQGNDIVLSVNDATATFPLRLSVDAADAVESVGSVTSVVRRPLGSATTSALIVELASSHPTRAHVPATVTIPIGRESVSFGVTIVDDDILNGNQQVTITGQANGITDGTTQVNVIDDDVVGFVVTQSDNSTEAAEGGTTDSMTIALAFAPTSDVIIDLSNSDSAQLSADQTSLTFTPANWNLPQTVTVTAVDDLLVDGSVTVNLGLAVNDSLSDDAFDNVRDEAVDVLAIDNDAAGFAINTTAVVVSESGTAQTAELVLTARPINDVVFDLSSNNLAEATVEPVTVTFTTDNWNVPVDVTIRGVDDEILDGSQGSEITVAVNSSSDAAFAGLASQTIMATTDDDDVAGFELSESRLSVDEDGGTATFEVVLSSGPASAVALLIASNNPALATVDLSSVVFTPTNWNTPQLVTVTGIGNEVDDGGQAVGITVSVDDTQSDAGFDNLDDQVVTVTTIDNDSAGVTVSHDAAPATSESGSSAVIDVQLDSQPLADVILIVSSGNTNEATTDVQQLVFTASDWNQIQQVTVTGVDDSIDDGDQPVVISLSVDGASDAAYQSVTAATVDVTNEDDDTAGVTVSATDLQTSESGTQDTVDVVLNTQPVTDVTIELTIDDPAQLTADVASIVFTAANWDQPQSVTLSAVDDSVVDGTVIVKMTASVTDDSDDEFRLLADQVFDVQVDDDEQAGVQVELPDPFTLIEGGSSKTIDVRLTSAPLTNVILNFASLDGDQFSVAPSEVTFTPETWDVSRSITVIAVDDQIVDGTRTGNLRIRFNDASDPAFSVLPDEQVSFQVQDNEVAGVGVTPDSDLQLTEGSAGQPLQLVLDHQPLTNVVLRIESADATVAVVDQPSVVFTPSNWNVPQSVDVSGPNNQTVGGSRQTTVTISVDGSSDSAFVGLTAVSRNVIVSDDDTAGFSVGDAVSISENAGQAGVTVVLDAQPESDVVFNITSSDEGVFTVGETTLVFTTENWNSAQTVTVTGTDNAVRDGDVAAQLSIAVDSTSNANFVGLAAQTVSVTVTDDEQSAVIVVATGDDTTVSESETTDTVSITLATQPAGTVVVTVASNDESEFTVDVQSLEFNSTNWNQPQVVTVTGVADTVFDDDQVSQLLVAVDDSASDPLWHGIGTQADVTTTGNSFSLDLDDDKETLALTDGLLTLRFLSGFTGQPLTSGAVNSEGDRTSPEAISAFLNGQIEALDIDGNGQARALTDGVLVLRYLSGFRGETLIAGAVDEGATRQTFDEIEAYLAASVIGGGGNAAGPIAASQGLVYRPVDDEIDEFFSTKLTNTRGF